jgi:hypothetical protein
MAAPASEFAKISLCVGVLTAVLTARHVWQVLPSTCGAASTDGIFNA